jgi:hypothetical protein
MAASFIALQSPRGHAGPGAEFMEALGNIVSYVSDGGRHGFVMALPSL